MEIKITPRKPERHDFESLLLKKSAEAARRIRLMDRDAYTLLEGVRDDFTFSDLLDRFRNKHGLRGRKEAYTILRPVYMGMNPAAYRYSNFKSFDESRRRREESGNTKKQTDDPTKTDIFIREAQAEARKFEYLNQKQKEDFRERVWEEIRRESNHWAIKSNTPT